MSDCPACGQSLPQEPTWDVFTREDGQISATVRQGEHKGWALRSTEEEARNKAILRLRYAEMMDIR